MTANTAWIWYRVLSKLCLLKNRVRNLLYNSFDWCLVYCFHPKKLELFGVLTVYETASGFKWCCKMWAERKQDSFWVVVLIPCFTWVEEDWLWLYLEPSFICSASSKEGLGWGLRGEKQFEAMSCSIFGFNYFLWLSLVRCVWGMLWNFYFQRKPSLL